MTLLKTAKKNHGAPRVPRLLKKLTPQSLDALGSSGWEHDGG